MSRHTLSRQPAPIPHEETFEGIWEKTEKWPDGSQILFGIVSDLKGKSLVATFDDVNSTVQVTLPKSVKSAVHLIPTRLHEVFETILQEVLDNCTSRITRIVDPCMGYVMEPPLLAQINRDLQDLERNAELEGAATLADIVNRAFGLPDRFASMYYRSQEGLRKLMR